MASGYTHCKCEDCFDITVSDDDTKPELCSLCEEAGCSGEEGDECCRDDAYGQDEDHEDEAEDEAEVAPSQG